MPPNANKYRCTVPVGPTGRLPCRCFGILCSVLLTSACTRVGPSTEDGQAAEFRAPKVILIIGDGMDDQQITIARNYLVGNAGRLTLDSMPFRAAVQTQTVDEDDPSIPVYVPDSANTATSIATGAITSAGRISTTAKTDLDLETIVELARDAGYGTGIVSTASLTDATPASFATHINMRFCEGPSNMTGEILGRAVDCSQNYKSNGGKGSISEQLADSRIDVLLGGGLRYFEQPSEGDAETTVLAEARENGYQVVLDRNGLTTIEPGRRVLGLFSPNTMPVRLRGTGDAKAELIERIDGKVVLPEPFVCEPNPQFDGMPALTEMTRAALGQLDETKSFFLVIESASIDKQSHLRRPCGHIGELAQLDEALAAVLDYAESHPETLVLVTADHSHAAQLVADRGEFLALNFASPGHFALIRTPEGGTMGINYATNDSPIQEYHTGAEIPLFASGPGIGTLPSFMRQAEIFGIMARHLGLAAHQD